MNESFIKVKWLIVILVWTLYHGKCWNNKNVFISIGIQGSDIGDVKFNEDGDAMGRYSVYQYQRQPKENSKGKYPDTF